MFAKGIFDLGCLRINKDKIQNPMKINLLLLGTSIFALSLILFGSSNAIAQEKRPAHLGLFYPISTHGTSAPEFSNHFSLHMISGVSGGEYGLAVYGLVGVIKGNAKGLQIAGLVNNLEGELQGMQVAGLVNRAKYASNGIQIAGIANKSQGTSSFQSAGILNKTTEIQGLQVGGIINLSEKATGSQFAGIANRTKTVKGLQVAGVVNVAENVEGTQVGGLVNRAKTVRGVQISGLLNIADSSDYPIGIINLIKTGEKRISIGADENFSTLITFRSGGNQFYGIFGLGSTVSNDHLRYGIEAGLGWKMLESEVLRVDLETVNLFFTDFKGAEFSKSGIRLLPAVKFANNLQVYLGPSLNYIHADNTPTSTRKGLELWSNNGSTNYHAIHLGFNAGLQIVL
jgi:hypothetical protein